MGTLPDLAVLKGPQVKLSEDDEPITLHRIFENTVAAIERISQNNNNEIKTIHSIEIKESIAQKIALISESSKLKFLELNKIANKLARAILKNLSDKSAKQNCDGDVLIAVSIRPSEALVITLLAIWKTGAAYLPLDVAFPKNRIEHILKESQPAMVIVDECDIGEEFHAIKYADLKLLSTDLKNENLLENETLSSKIPKKNLLAAVMYTSGSTGVPKGVRITHAATLNRLKWQWRTFPYSATEKVCVFKTALVFVDSVCELWGPLLNARSILIVQKEDTKNPETLVGLLEQYQIERLILVPTLLQTILLYLSTKKYKDFLKNLRLWVCSGETLSVSLAKQFFDTFDNKSQTLCNFYGSTEVMGDVTYHIIRSKEEIENQEKIAIGKPLDNCNIYVLNKTLQPVNNGEIGELYVSGWNLASGYVRGRDPSKFIENSWAVDPGHFKLYKTGDFAKVIGNVVYYEGRTDSQIKIRGHRVDLSEIESALAKIKEIDKFVVLTYQSGEVNQALVTFVTVKTKKTEKELEESLAAVLAPYMLPQVIIVDHFPLLVNGKVDRQYFLNKYKNEYDHENNQTLKKNLLIDYTGIPTEKLKKAKVLFETIIAVLGRSLRTKINEESNFYSLGGNSLNSVLTVTKLQDLGFSISIGDFISSSTLSEVINKMKEENITDILDNKLNHNYNIQLLQEDYKKDVFEVIISSFYKKADLEKHLVPSVKLSEYEELMEALWPHLLEKNLSFAVFNLNGDIEGAALNFDAFDEPEILISPNNKLNIVFEFLEFLEGPIREKKLPQGKNKVLHSFMMGTKTNLSSQKAIEIFLIMEEQVLNLAKERKFEGVFTSNTNALTQQLGCDVNNYQVLLNYQVNKYIASDGSQPFAKAPDSQTTTVSWKKL